MSEETKTKRYFDRHRKSNIWDEALAGLSPMWCGRLDLTSYDGLTGEPENFVYVDGTDERTHITGPHCDHVAYAANRYQPMLTELTTLRASHTLLVEMLKGIRGARKRRGYDVRMIDELLRNAEEVCNE